MPALANGVASKSIAAVIPAAGSGHRFGGDRNKLFARLAGQPLWTYAVGRLAARPEIGRIVMAVSDEDRDIFAGRDREYVSRFGVELVPGGAERTDSVRAAIDAVANDSSIEWLAVHDAARPLVSDADLRMVFESAASGSGAAILATPVSGTLKRDLGDRRSSSTVDRRDLWIAMTPQVFRVGLLNQAYRKHNGRPATDDAQLVERIGHDVALVHGSADNIKITYPEDLLIAEAILARQQKDV